MNYGLSYADATPGQTFVIGGMNKVKEAVKEDKMKTLIKVLMPFIVSFLFSCVACGQLEATTPEKAILNPGKIGVVSASFRPESAFQKPLTRGTAAAHGAGFGAIAPIAGGFYLGGRGMRSMVFF